MIYAVIGAASPRFRLVKQLTHFLLERVHENLLVCHVNTADELKHQLADRNGAPCLITSECPEDIIVELIARTRLPAVLLCESFQTLHASAAELFSMDFYSAARGVSKRLSAMHGLAGLSNVATIRLTDDDKLVSLVSRIATSLDIPATDEQLSATVIAHSDPDDTETSILSACRRVHNLTDRIVERMRNYTVEERHVLAGLSRSYDVLLTDADANSINWPMEMLISADSRSPLSGPIELIGPARIISFGPYLHVPKGMWTVTLTFTVRENYSGNRLMIDIYIPTLDVVVIMAKGELPVQGAFSTSFDFNVESSHHAIEVRMYTQVGAIEGILEVADITLRKGAAEIRRPLSERVDIGVDRSTRSL